MGCSNSEGVDGAGWEYAYDDTDGVIEPGKQDCFNSFRLPDLQSIACKKKFFSSDTIKDFPQSGFFPKTFTIAFPNNKPLNCEIGGKVPTAESPRISAIQIDSSTTIRCADLSDSASTKSEIIRTYILEKAPDIATVFITTDPNSLFDPDTGIYMEGPNAEEKEPHYGANYWLDKEIPVFVELVEPGASTPGFSKYAGLEISGSYSRMQPKKSVAIVFREKYGDKRLNYKLFPEFPNLNIFKSFILRNNGQNFRHDYIRDRLATSLSEGLGLDYQQGRFAIVYYNGKYFGIHDLRERSNEYYFETHYGINKKNINLLKARNQISSGSSADYIAIESWLKEHNLSNADNYKYILSQIDVDNYINYILLEIFVNNRDWPGNNLKKWNSVVPKTPWKWFLYDLDYSLGKSSSTTSMLEYALSKNATDWINGPTYTILLRSLMENEDFKKSFINRMATLLQTSFNSVKALPLIEKMMSEIKSEIPRDQAQWSLDSSKMNKQLDVIKRFIDNRPNVINNEFRDYFKLGKNKPITYSIKGNGTIFIHNHPLKAYPTTIYFFNGTPVTITAVPKEGYKFSHWSDGEKNTTRTIWPEETKDISAIFE